MTDDEKLMQQALDAMMTIRPYEVVDYDQLEASITALRERMAQPVQEPVPINCRQRLKAEGKPYPKSSCASCGEFSPKYKECDSLLTPPQPAEQPVQEPFALLVRKHSWNEGQYECAPPNAPEYGRQWADERVLVYASPPQRKPLTDEQERKAFEQWYACNSFDYERHPIGSRECGLQWSAWKARAAHGTTGETK